MNEEPVEHSATPYEVIGEQNFFEIGYRLPTGGIKALGCLYDGGVEWTEKGKALPAKENAEFIVKACNNYKYLVHAIKSLLAGCDSICPDKFPGQSQLYLQQVAIPRALEALTDAGERRS